LQFTAFFKILEKSACYLSSIIRDYFASKFQEIAELRPRIPTIIDESLIFDPSIIVLLALQNDHFRRFKYLQLKYSTESSGMDLQQLKNSLAKHT